MIRRLLVLTMALTLGSAESIRAQTPNAGTPQPTEISAEQLHAAHQAHDRGDYASALRIWMPLADKGNARAQTNLGVMYANGHGVPLDYGAAAGWFRKAAEQGDTAGLNGLGYHYDMGHGVPQDHVRVHKWYSMVAANSSEAYRLNSTKEASGATASIKRPIEANTSQGLASLQQSYSRIKANLQQRLFRHTFGIALLLLLGVIIATSVAFLIKIKISRLM
ncbi:tetratricopeptide repeat protein [uncultured Brevundimonas sp.]|uniref:tetratricopeptide repeat protein n=1 Tax=uncultured Brevundimonas sp. TaxID=213418 RepID=UPI0030EC0D2F